MIFTPVMSAATKILLVFLLTLPKVTFGTQRGSSTSRPEPKWYKSDVDDDKSNDPQDNQVICQVCNKDFDKFPGFHLDCGHTFHDFCLRQWDQDCYGELARGCPCCCKQITLKGGQRLRDFLSERDKSLANHEKELWGLITSITGDLFGE